MLSVLLSTHKGESRTQRNLMSNTINENILEDLRITLEEQGVDIEDIVNEGDDKLYIVSRAYTKKYLQEKVVELLKTKECDLCLGAGDIYEDSYQEAGVIRDSQVTKCPKCKGKKYLL